MLTESKDNYMAGARQPLSRPVIIIRLSACTSRHSLCLS